MALHYIPSKTWVIINGGEMTHLAQDDFYDYSKEGDKISYKLDLKHSATIISHPSVVSNLTLRLVDGGYTQNELVNLLNNLERDGTREIFNTISIGNASLSDNVANQVHWECGECYLLADPGSTGSSDGRSDVELRFVCINAITHKKGYRDTLQANNN